MLKRITANDPNNLLSITRDLLNFQDSGVGMDCDLSNKSFHSSWFATKHNGHIFFDAYNFASTSKDWKTNLDKSGWGKALALDSIPQTNRIRKMTTYPNQVYTFTSRLSADQTLNINGFSDLFETTRTSPNEGQNNLDISSDLAVLNTTQTSLNFQDLTAETGRGFGDSENRYSWSVIEHNGSLFVGTLNLTNGGEVWKTSLDQTDWIKVLDFGNQVDGIRELVTYQNQIYAFTTGFRITEPSGFVSSDNGESWSELTGGPLESRINESVRSSTVYNDLLYIGTFDSSGAEVWTFNGTSWNLVKKFSSEIEEISNFIEFEGELYVGVWNQGSYFFTGNTFGIDVTPSFGGRQFESNIGGVIDTVVFQDQLYLSTWNFINGFGLFRTADPLTGQWEIVTSNGFGDRNNAYGWSMAVYDDPLTTVEGDELYLGTFNTGLYDSNSQGFDGLAELYSTSDGDNWQQVSLPDFGQFTWGIRNVVVTTSDKLILGTATNYLAPEGDEVGTQVWIADL